MPPKPPNKEKGSQKENAVVEDEEPLKAVVLADSFDKRFTPLTLHTPRCLLPMCNVPLLEWTFEALALAGVSEVFVVCRSHVDKIKAAIAASKWSKPSSGLTITPILTATECASAGDAMRELDTHGVLKGDFVLVSGDLVSNIQLEPVVAAHRARRRADPDALMTIVLKESGARHRTRSKAELGVFVLDSNTHECLHYESVRGYPPQTHAKIPREVLKEHPEIDVRNDLIDCYIDICSVQVPSLFQENFDYADIRRDFVHGVLTSDLLMKKIYCHVITDGYAARVSDTKSYASITNDILARWTFPNVPDDNYPGSSTPSYELTPGNTYLALGTKDTTTTTTSSSPTSPLLPPQRARTARTGPLTLLGPSTSLSADAHAIRTVLGAHTTLAPSARVTSSILFDNVRVGARARVEGAVLGRGVVVGEDAVVERGCLVADGVVLGHGARLGRFMRVSVRPSEEEERKGQGEEDEDEDEDDEEAEMLERVMAAQTPELRACLGPGSNGLIWPESIALGDEEDDSSDEDEDDSSRRNKQDKLGRARLIRLGDSASDLELTDPGSDTASSSSSSEDEDEGEEEGEGVGAGGVKGFESESESELESGDGSKSEFDVSELQTRTPTSTTNSRLTVPGSGTTSRSMSRRTSTSSINTSHLSSSTTNPTTTNTTSNTGLLSLSSSTASTTSYTIALAAAREFALEARATLARAFTGGHTIADTATELKTLRMSVNVPLRRAREAVVEGVVELIPILGSSAQAQQQRVEIARVVKRWGPLVDAIGGRDPVETVCVLQEFCSTSSRMPLFGQILAAFYQEDIIEEDDIRQWYSLPASRGEGPGAENMRKLWTVGSRMIAQFDAQEESSSEEDGDSDDDGDDTE